MKQELQERRDRASERHDAVRAQDPKGQTTATLVETRAVIDEFKAVIAEADHEASDPVELGKTYRWLADAYADLCEFASNKEHSAKLGDQKKHYAKCADEAYRKAEPMIVSHATLIEQAKLNFNFAEHLWRSADSTDVAALEAAIARFADAAETASANNLMPMAQAAEDRVERLNSTLPMALLAANAEAEVKDIDDLMERLKNAGPAEQQRISDELARIEAKMMRSDPVKTVEQAFDELAASMPGQEMDDRGNAALASFREQYEAMSECAEPANSGSADTELFNRARDVIKKAMDAGELSQEGSDLFTDVINRLDERSHDGPPRGKTMTESISEIGMMQQLLDQVTRYATDRNSYNIKAPKGQVGERAATILNSLYSWLIAENSRRGRPWEESTRGLELFKQVAQLKKKLRDASGETAELMELVDSIWRMAADIQLFARRHHLMLTRPEFSVSEIKARSRSLFLSGGMELQSAADILSKRDSLELFAETMLSVDTSERWSQLRAATVAVFDVGTHGSMRAQVHYELGLALALGKPIVVVTHRGATIEFNIPLKPIHFGKDAEANAEQLDAGIAQSLSAIVWGGATDRIEGAPDRTLNWIEQNFGGGLSEVASALLTEARRNKSDAMMFQHSVTQLVGRLGPGQPSILFPVWPPAYPDPESPLRCFHVTPFGQGEVKKKFNRRTKEARKYLETRGWEYMRGDEGQEQRVLDHIWREISTASAVLVDITDHNPNVALELGLAHALGRPCFIVQEGEAPTTFPAVDKIQVHRYHDEEGFKGIWCDFEEWCHAQ